MAGRRVNDEVHANALLIWADEVDDLASALRTLAKSAGSGEPHEDSRLAGMTLMANGMRNMALEMMRP